VPDDISRHQAPLGTGDGVFPHDWEPVIDELASSSPASARPRARVTSDPDAVRIFHGRIESIGTLEIVKALAQSRASGLVSFETNPQGALLLEDGLIVGASWGELSGAPALAQLLLLEEGTFRVGAHLLDVMTEDSRAPQALLLDALHLVAQRRAKGADDAGGRLEHPAPRRFRLPGTEPSASSKPASAGVGNGSRVVLGNGNGKPEIAGPVNVRPATAANGNGKPAIATAANGGSVSPAAGNPSNGSVSNGETRTGRLLRDLGALSANGNHSNGKHVPAEPKAQTPGTSNEQDRISPTPTDNLPADADLTRSPQQAAGRPTGPAAPSVPAGQLRSKSLWWIDTMPSAASPPDPVPRPLESRSFASRTLDKLRGSGRRRQPQK
jgi:hypothetical protein